MIDFAKTPAKEGLHAPFTNDEVEWAWLGVWDDEWRRAVGEALPFRSGEEIFLAIFAKVIVNRLVGLVESK
jgi:hypothetical protein